MTVEELRKINQERIDSIEDDDVLRMHHLAIQKILEEDKFYFKMEVKYVYAILEDLGIEKEEIKNVYRELISIANNEELKNK